MNTLFDEKSVRTRLRDVYRAMGKRAQPKLWKTGRRAGTVKTPGLSALPFTFEQFWAYCLREIGGGARRCPYCVEIGRPANLIDLVNFVVDHVVPVARGGTWELANLRLVCKECNQEKSNLSLEFFLSLRAVIERWPDAKDRGLIVTSMRSTGVAQRLRGFHGKPKAQHLPPPAQTNRTLALQDDF